MQSRFLSTKKTISSALWWRTQRNKTMIEKLFLHPWERRATLHFCPRRESRAWIVQIWDCQPSVQTRKKELSQGKFSKPLGEISQESSSMTVEQSQEMDLQKMKIIGPWICQDKISSLCQLHSSFAPKLRTTTSSETFFSLCLNQFAFHNKYLQIQLKTSS